MQNKLKYIDTHSHIHFSDFNNDRADMMHRMQEASVGTIAIGTDLETSRQALALVEEYPDVVLGATMGMHPNDTDDQFDAEEFGTLLNSEVQPHCCKVLAVGECGLDYFRNDSEDKQERERQKKVFRAQIELAVEYKLPLMLHIRSSEGTSDAHDDVLEILSEYKSRHGDALRFHCHFTTFGIDLAKRFIDLDSRVTFGIPGVVSYKSAQDLQDLVRWLPIDKILSETDAPYAAPVPHRGKRNEPIFVIDIVSALAVLRGEDAEVVRKQLLENAKRVFNLDSDSQ